MIPNLLLLLLLIIDFPKLMDLVVLVIVANFMEEAYYRIVTVDRGRHRCHWRQYVYKKKK